MSACDRLGVLVMDEAFDMWTSAKSDFDYSAYTGGAEAGRHWLRSAAGPVLLRAEADRQVIAADAGDHAELAGGARASRRPDSGCPSG